jgi:hypothetical protein
MFSAREARTVPTENVNNINGEAREGGKID